MRLLAIVAGTSHALIAERPRIVTQPLVDFRGTWRGTWTCSAWRRGMIA